jgi:hypothetical protein
MRTFKIGETYSTRSIGDINCIFSITVEKRTAKTLTTTDGKVLRIRVYNDVEEVMPLGRYSMAPIIHA